MNIPALFFMPFFTPFPPRKNPQSATLGHSKGDGRKNREMEKGVLRKKPHKSANFDTKCVDKVVRCAIM